MNTAFPRMKETPWAIDILAEGADFLTNMNLKWWVDGGTLLGIVREGKLLDHDDPDLDVSVEEPADHELIKDIFTMNGYKIYAEGMHQLVFVKDDVLFDISFNKKEGKDLVMDVFGAGRAVHPYKHFKELDQKKFRGKYYPVPRYLPEYLTLRYGDWRTPKKEKRPWTEPGETLTWQGY